MKVATLVLFVAVAGLLMVGAVDAGKYGPRHCGPKDPVAISIATADSVACGPNLGIAYDDTCAEAYVIPKSRCAPGEAFARASATSVAIAA